MFTRVYKLGGGGPSDSSSPSRLFEDLLMYNCCAKNLTHFGSVRLETLADRFSGYALKLWPFERRSTSRVSLPVNPSSSHRPRGRENTTRHSRRSRCEPHRGCGFLQCRNLWHSTRMVGESVWTSIVSVEGPTVTYQRQSAVLRAAAWRSPALCRVVYD